MYTAILNDYARKILFHQGVEKGKCRVKHSPGLKITKAFVKLFSGTAHLINFCGSYFVMWLYLFFVT